MHASGRRRHLTKDMPLADKRPAGSRTALRGRDMHLTTTKPMPKQLPSDRPITITNIAVAQNIIVRRMDTPQASTMRPCKVTMSVMCMLPSGLHEGSRPFTNHSFKKGSRVAASHSPTGLRKMGGGGVRIRRRPQHRPIVETEEARRCGKLHPHLPHRSQSVAFCILFNQMRLLCATQPSFNGSDITVQPPDGLHLERV